VKTACLGSLPVSRNWPGSTPARCCEFNCASRAPFIIYTYGDNCKLSAWAHLFPTGELRTGQQQTYASDAEPRRTSRAGLSSAPKRPWQPLPAAGPRRMGDRSRPAARSRNNSAASRRQPCSPHRPAAASSTNSDERLPAAANRLQELAPNGAGAHRRSARNQQQLWPLSRRRPGLSREL